MARKSTKTGSALSGFSIESIQEFFRSPPSTYLGKEVAVCYILHTLLDRDSYGTELMDQLEEKLPTYRLSDTVLYAGLSFLEKEGIIVPYWKNEEGRGRPRRMWRLVAQWREEAQALANFWNEQKQRDGGSQCLT